MINTFQRTSALFPIQYGDQILQVGSCFSNHISTALRLAGFCVADNPFGIVFHPIAIADQFQMTLQGSVPNRFLQRDDIWLHYNANSSCYAFSKEDLMAHLNEQLAEFHQQISRARVILITFGSAHGYRFKNDELIVANCHQIPQVNFTKECTDAHEIANCWKTIIDQIKKINELVHFVFTVSPVKYQRDGWVENNRSKAQLIHACELLEKEANATYFPSYELVTDILRDYRFFEADGVHPNVHAIQEVWELFQNWFFDAETKVILEKVNEIRSRENHRLLFPDSIKGKEFIRVTAEKKKSLLSIYPNILL